MHRLLRLIPLAASIAASACAIPNPNFEVRGEATSATATGGAPGSSSADEITGADESSSAAGSTALATTASTQAATTTGEESGKDSSSGGAASLGTTGDGTTMDGTTGAPVPMTIELRHYSDLVQCNLPYWCYTENINNPSTAESRNAECFDAPFAPPFTVDRVGFMVFGTNNGPTARLEFHTYDNDAKQPTAAIFSAVDLGFITDNGYKEYTFDPPIVVDVPRFCISVHSGAQFDTQLGLALDQVAAPPGQTFVGIFGPGICKVATFTDITTREDSPQTQWCIDATISKSP